MRFIICFFIISYNLLGLHAQTIPAEIETTSDRANYILDNFDRIRSNNVDTAIFYLNLIISEAEKEQDLSLAARAYEKRGIAHYYQGKFAEERSDLLTALRYAERINDEGVMGNILKELGVSANRQKDFDNAISYGYRSIDLCEKAGDNNCLASAQRNLGRTYLKLDRRDSADHFIMASYELKVAMKDSFGLPFALSDLAELAMLDGKVEMAQAHLIHSADIRRVIRDSSGLAISLNNIGELLLMNKQPGKAASYFDQSLALSAPLKFVELQRNTLDQLSLAYEQDGDYLAAYRNLEKSQLLKDSLYNVKNAETISELQIQYESEKKVQVISQQKNELRLQRLIGISVLSFILLLGSFIYYRMYKRKKYEAKIQELEIRQKVHQERERISRDLHDNVGANLTRIITDLDLMGDTTASTAATSQPQTIASTRNFTSQTIRLLRDTIWALNKDSYPCSEFVRKAKTYLASYLQDRVTWNVTENIQVDHQLSSNEVLHLLRILQESAQNMLKHAEATALNVNLITNKNTIVLTIKDNGKGAKISSENIDDHYGLQNMKRRAEEIGAQLEFTSASARGFETEIILPANK